MDINRVLEELDTYFKEYRTGEVEPFLISKMKEAEREGDSSSLVTLLNEMIGFCRDTSQYDKAGDYCRQVLQLLGRMGLEGTIPYATTLLNVANAYRAAGRWEESMEHYDTVFSLYQNKLSNTDFRYASLYNNRSLLYQEMGEFGKAAECLENALSIISNYKEAKIETAVTHTNLSAALLRLHKKKQAKEHILAAQEIFLQDQEKDFHYSAALSVLGEISFLEGDFAEAKKYYEEALFEIEKHTGKNESYERTRQNLERVKAAEQEKKNRSIKAQNGLLICEKFYWEYGEPMIQRDFKDYANSIAAGLVGEGSECLGYDDEISRDHDFGPAFCLWLTKDIYERIGEELSMAYKRLIQEYDKNPVYEGITRIMTPEGSNRTGVWEIGAFCERCLGIPGAPATESDWLYLEDERLITLANGKVFKDPCGVFSEIRNKILDYYPEPVRIRKIALQASRIAQSGQYNFPRMMKRADCVSASLSLGDFVRHTMKMLCLLKCEYAPYDKWLYRKVCSFPEFLEITDILKQIVQTETNPEQTEYLNTLISKVSALILFEIRRQGLSDSQEPYLDYHKDLILNGKKRKSELIEKLISIEWEDFDHVKNEGGRADCQDDFATFSIMRKSQYMTWTSELLKSYIMDFIEARKENRNLITEKYGRMMESTSPKQYKEIEHGLKPLTKEQKAIMEEIIKIQVGWMEDFSVKYPLAAGNARSIHTTEDTMWNTSYETYLRGELATYSETTLSLYGRFIVMLAQNEENLAVMTMENTAELYGYTSLSDLEERLRIECLKCP